MNTQGIKECGKQRPEKQRDSNLELYRIVVMLLIVAHHYVVNSGLSTPIHEDPLSSKSLFLLLFGAWGKTGINCFVLVTGYFMSKSCLSANKIAKLFFEILFYGLVIYFIFVFSGYTSFSVISFIKLMLPITDIKTGFTSCYLAFMLLIPYLNILINNITEKQHLYLVIICVVLYVIIGTSYIFSVSINYVSWFVVLYFIAAYLRHYPKKIFENTKVWGWATVASFALASFSVIVLTYVGTRIGKLGFSFEYFLISDSNKLFAVTTALSSFLFFKNLKIPFSRIINNIAASTFGVFLIHTHSATMRNWLWVDILQNAKMYYCDNTVWHAIGSTVLVFVVCTVVDRFRVYFVEPHYLRILEKPIVILSTWYNGIEKKFCERFGIRTD